MWIIIVNAVVFAALLVLVVVPPLFIYDPKKHPDQQVGPPSAGEVIPSDTASESVKQKLYMLFMIPACACVNMILFYFIGYRPLRYVVYRVEQNTLSLYQNRLHGDQMLRNVGINVLASTAGLGPQRSQTDFGMMRQPAENLSAVASNAAAESSSYRINLALRSHARPKTVRKDSYVSAAVLPEIKNLRETIEKNFLEPSEASEKQFLDAVRNAVDSFIVVDSGAPILSMPDAPADPHDNFYNSSKPRLALDLGKTAPGHGRSAAADGVYSGDLDDTPPRAAFPRANRSMVLLVSDAPAGKRGNNSPISPH